jgi:cytochrome P450
MSELDPKRFKERTKNLSAGFTLSNILKSEHEIDTQMSLFFSRLDGLAANEESVEFDKWFNYIAFDCLGLVTFSRSFGFVEEGTDIRGAIANTHALAIYIAVMGHFVWLHNLTLGNPLMSKLGFQPSSHIFDTAREAIEERSRVTEEKHDMMEEWLRVRRTHPERMSEKEIFANASTNIGAGSDPIATVLQVLVYHLLKHPQHMQKLRNELDEAQSRGQLSRIVSYAESQNLPYLRACVCSPALSPFDIQGLTEFCFANRRSKNHTVSTPLWVSEFLALCPAAA